MEQKDDVQFLFAAAFFCVLTIDLLKKSTFFNHAQEKLDENTSVRFILKLKVKMSV